MKKVLILLFAGCLCNSAIFADGYTIAGKLRDVAAARVYLVAADFGRADTLASAVVQNDAFLLTGSVRDGVRAVKLLFEGIEGELPVLLENIPYQVSITRQGAIIEGEGPAAKLLKEFETIGREYAAEKNRIEAEYEALSADVNDAKVQSLQLRMDNAYKESIRKTEDLIKANADNYIAAYVVALGRFIDDEAVLRAKYGLLGTAARATTPGQAITATIEQYDKLAIGEVAPNFALTKPDGNKFSLHGLKTKWKLVTFWSSTNAVSRQENPDLVRIYLQFRPKGFDIVSVSLDTDPVAWKKAVGLDGLIWTNVSDLKGFESEVVRLYQVNDLPRNFLLDADNRIVARDLHGAKLHAKLMELTKKTKKK